MYALRNLERVLLWLRTNGWIWCEDGTWAQIWVGVGCTDVAVTKDVFIRARNDSRLVAGLRCCCRGIIALIDVTALVEIGDKKCVGKNRAFDKDVSSKNRNRAPWGCRVLREIRAPDFNFRILQYWYRATIKDCVVVDKFASGDVEECVFGVHGASRTASVFLKGAIGNIKCRVCLIISTYS